MWSWQSGYPYVTCDDPEGRACIMSSFWAAKAALANELLSRQFLECLSQWRYGAVTTTVQK